MNCLSEITNCGTKNVNNVCKRKNVAKKSEWKQNVNKKKRMEGEQYLGISKTVPCQKAARKLGETCLSQYCQKSALRNCSKFTEAIRNEIFNLFWNMSSEQKRMYVTALTKICDLKKFLPADCHQFYDNLPYKN